MFKKNLLLTPHYLPHLGGVEKHVFYQAQYLQKRGYQVMILTQKSNHNLSSCEEVDGCTIHRFSFPKIRFFGLLLIWWRMLFSYWQFFNEVDIIHIHDVMIWLLPIRLLLPRKKIILTMHGWEGNYPIPKKNIFLKKIAQKMANKVICVGKYICQYYQIECDLVIEGGVELQTQAQKTNKKNQLLVLGRLEEDTGLSWFLDLMSEHILNSRIKIIFAGDGSLHHRAQKLGEVKGWLPEKKVNQLLAESHWCLATGYLSALEALSCGCQVIAIANNPLKVNYWQKSKLINWIHLVKDYRQLKDLFLQIEQGGLKKKAPTPTQLEQFSWQKVMSECERLYQ